MHNAAEILRLLNNVVRLGTIAQVDHDAARVRVVSGALHTGWLAWLTPRAGDTRHWSPPTVGEQVILLAPSGDPANAVVLTGLYSSAHAAPSNSATVHRTEYPDGAVIEYDHAAHHLAATLPGSAALHATGDIDINTQANLTLHADGNVKISGDRVDLNL